jgi:hypothetical protein
LKLSLWAPKMRFDPTRWGEAVRGFTAVPPGRLIVNTSRLAALFVAVRGLDGKFGAEALVGFGSHWDVELSQHSAFICESGDKDCRCFFYIGKAVPYVDSGVRFTNIDRTPSESGSMLEVRKGLRELELMRRAALRDIHAAQAEYRRNVLAAKPKVDSKPLVATAAAVGVKGAVVAVPPNPAVPGKD